MIYGGNPALRQVQKRVGVFETTERASYSGIALKSIYFILLTFAAALGAFIGTIYFAENGNFGIIAGLLIVSMIAAVVSSIIAVIFPSATKVAGSIYAACQGFMMGFLALIFYSFGFSGEIFAALIATVATFGIMLSLYSTGVIRVGSGFRKFMISALISMMLVNLVMFVVSLFSPSLSNLFYGNGALSVFISIIMVMLASLMILLDLDRMTQIVKSGLDKKYEWIASFGLLVTLIWLYTEFLRLFLKLANRK